MPIKNKNSYAIYIFLILSGVVSAALVLISTSLFGPCITPDSTAYMYASNSLLHGKGFEYLGYPSPFIQWPPLLPILLACAGAIGVEPITAANYINAVAQGLIIVFSGYWLFTRLKNKLIAIFGTILLVFSVPLLLVSKCLWTETLSILLFLGFYFAFERFLKTQSYKSLIISGIFSALACLDRYAGVTIILVAALFLLIQKKGFYKRFIDIFIYGAISSLPFVVWVVRNYIVSHTLLGVRIPSTYSLKLNIKRTLQSIYTWILPDAKLTEAVTPGILQLFKIFAAAIPVLILVVFVIIMILKYRNKDFEFSIAKNEQINVRYLSIAFYIVFSIIYSIYLIASATKVLFEPINSRYVVPVYLPVVFIIICSADIIIEMFAKRISNRKMRIAAVLLTGILLIYPIINTCATVINAAGNGAGGFSTYAWHNNKLIKYVKENPQDCTYYSNSADAVYALTNKRAFYPPKKSGPYMYGLEQFKKNIENDKCSYIIWFKKGVPNTLYNIEEISQLFSLEIIEKNSDGTVYKVKK